MTIVNYNTSLSKARIQLTREEYDTAMQNANAALAATQDISACTVRAIESAHIELELFTLDNSGDEPMYRSCLRGKDIYNIMILAAAKPDALSPMAWIDLLN